MGIIQYSSYDCKVLIQSRTTRSGQETQIQQGYQYKEPLFYISCRVQVMVYIWKDEKYFVQDGFYNYASPPVNIHLNPDKEA